MVAGLGAGLAAARVSGPGWRAGRGGAGRCRGWVVSGRHTGGTGLGFEGPDDVLVGAAARRH